MLAMNKRNLVLAAMGALALGFGAFSATAQTNKNLTGTVKVDGSSTVYPITEAVAEEFAKEAPGVRVTVGISGTGGGFKRFVVGETDISNASRSIKKEELEAASSNAIDFIEIPVAYDGLSIVVNKSNTFVDKLTLAEIKKIFLDGGAKTWKEVRPTWPDKPIRVYSPGTDSGTFDYFKEVVAGKSGAIRGDMSVSEDDNVLVRGVSGDENSIGFFGCAYYFENKDKLRVIPVDNGAGPVTPTHETIETGSYAPFSRPLFIYVNSKSAMRPEVQAFVAFYLKNAAELADEVGYVRLPDEIYKRATQRWGARKGGTAFIDAAGHSVEGPLTKVYN
jgi:phosphate transport system substrate-binding protein